MVNDCLNYHVKDVIHQSQHGFTKGRSCNTNLVEFSSFISTNLERMEVKQVDVVYFDLSSAFDKVPVIVVLKALECHGISGSLLEWFGSFLSNRRQYVMVREGRSGFFYGFVWRTFKPNTL